MSAVSTGKEGDLSVGHSLDREGSHRRQTGEERRFTLPSLLDLFDGSINCGAVRTARIGGVDQRIMVAIHTRITPEHQRKGLWGALSRLLGEKYSPSTGITGSCGYGSVDNEAIQRGFAHVREKWDPGPVRLLLDCAAQTGPDVGRPATPDKDAHLVTTWFLPDIPVGTRRHDRYLVRILAAVESTGTVESETSGHARLPAEILVIPVGAHGRPTHWLFEAKCDIAR